MDHLDGLVCLSFSFGQFAVRDMNSVQTSVSCGSEVFSWTPGGAPTPSLCIDCETDPEAVAVTSSGRRAVILKALYSEAVGHL